MQAFQHFLKHLLQQAIMPVEKGLGSSQSKLSGPNPVSSQICLPLCSCLGDVCVAEALLRLSDSCCGKGRKVAGCLPVLPLCSQGRVLLAS